MAGSRSMSSGMQDRLNLRVAPPSLTDFDDSDAVPAANAQALMQIQPAGLHKDVILISLLKGWCEANGKSTSKSQRLYKKMFRKFQEHQVISPAHIEALKQCNYDFLLKTLASLSLSSPSDDSPDGSAVLPFIHNMSSPDLDQSSYCQERYKKDFIQKELIGEGSYGKVYKVQHKLDKKYYAVKKIKVTKKEPRSLLREIETLACLNHPNVVRYHQSWLEGELTGVSQLTEKQPLMLALGSFIDKGIGYKGEEEERKEIENDADDSCQENEDVSKLGSTSPIITELVETRSQCHSQQTSMTVSMNRAEMDPFDPNFTVSFEDERFDSGELVNEFFSQTSEDVENIWPLVYNKKEEECDRINDSVESSGTSGSTIIFQNVESDGMDCDEFNLPSLKEQISSRVEFVRQLHIETSSKSEIKITTTTNSKTNVQSTIIPVTSATSAFLSTLTSSLSSSTHIQNRICAAPSRSQQPIRNGKFRRSISWDGQESHPEVESGYYPQSKPLFKERYYFYIQMELCSSTLGAWLDKRNKNISKTENQFDVVNDKMNRNLFKQILEGMNYIHSKGILHRDVTPKNIFLSDKDDGQLVVKIGDFGLAREDVLTEPKTPIRLRRDRDLDGTLMCRVVPYVSRSLTSGIGTVEYGAPEQFNESTYDNKCDMYSLGLILLELYHPFRSISDKHKCFGELLPDGKIPKELQERWPAQCSAIQSLTSYDSAKRPSAADLLSGDMFLSKDTTKLTEEMTNKLNSEQAKVTELTNALDTTQMQLVEANAGLAEKTQSELVLADRVSELEASYVSLHAELTAEQKVTAHLKKQTELQDGSLAESITKNTKCVLLEQQIVTKDNVQKDMQQKIEVLEKELAKKHELCKNYEVKLESKINVPREPAIRQQNAEISQLKENRIPKSRQTSGQQKE